MEGKANYKPGRDFFGNSYGDRMHVVGPGKAPLWIGLKRDVPKLVTSEFWQFYDIWRRFHLGFGPPGPGTWADHDPWLVLVVSAFEEHHRRYFSKDAADMKIAEGTAERLNVIAKQLNQVIKGFNRRR